jgi:hypothetical protein
MIYFKLVQCTRPLLRNQVVYNIQLKKDEDCVLILFSPTHP